MITKLISCGIGLLLCNISFAKIWRVNNGAGITADFTTAQAANDAVTVLAGDTIHLEPSITSYGSLSTNKRLVWLSTGAFLTNHPTEQVSVTPGSVNYLTVNLGSDNSVFSINCTGYIYCYSSNIRFERCYGNIFLSFQAASNNNVVINCYFRGDLDINSGANLIITNNIFEGQLSVPVQCSAIITNNVFNAATART